MARTNRKAAADKAAMDFVELVNAMPELTADQVAQRELLRQVKVTAQTASAYIHVGDTVFARRMIADIKNICVGLLETLPK